MIVTGDRVAARTPQRGPTPAANGSQPEEAFARALRGKALAADDTGTGDGADGDGGASGNGSSQACAPTGLIASAAGLSQPSPAPGRGAGAVGNGGDGPTAAIEAAGSTAAASAAAAAARSIPEPTAVDPNASAWEASVRDGNGIAVDLRAEPAPSGPGENAAWSVTVVSPALAAEILARHAPDLTDRLRRRGIAGHVRIAGSRHAAEEST